ncbi:pleurocidin-like peptide WF3 [Parambassis ranga]|uniref:Pleurocidin-like peptide WF3 n=1 Tax=Parambassis ranga TaxID=210632 RepID=A0A6P7HF62_9TELE|nr:pleurocidin-like peptide WF3 [Parambassis ranga]
MKCTALFLVLSMVVLMAEPGECIFGLVLHGISHLIHGLVNGGKEKDQQVEIKVDKRSLDYRPGRPAFN